MLPLIKPPPVKGKYDIYPSFRIDDNNVSEGYDSLFKCIRKNRLIIIDGYNGAGFDAFRENLEKILEREGITSSWKNFRDFYLPEKKIREITNPFLGESDPLFGTRTSLVLEDLLIPGKKESYIPDPGYDINFVIGPGASLIQQPGLLIYIDIPKNEILAASRRGEMTNLGLSSPSGPKEMYKYFYFVEWIILNRHKELLLPHADIWIDCQRRDTPVWMEGRVLRQTLRNMSHSIFRARPWFESGTWGGSWMKNNIPGLRQDVPNYAWSYELITPENGLLIESSSMLLEVSFDCLMFQEAGAVLGDCHPRFGNEFPIRFDFLDTFDGGNLSIQCHPRPEYMKKHFGEDFTQEESYYILDTKDNALVYLGFREDADSGEFHKELSESQKDGRPVEISKFILSHQVKKHDLLLIPYGTIHGSGRNNLVLEISSTPYIFTFKMYDWLRPDLDGRPRPLNIERGMDNLYFERKGSLVNNELISRPAFLSSGKGWEHYHLPTHETHFYDVHRYHITGEKEINTGNKCLVMNLVEGECIEIITSSGVKCDFNFAETFVVPAAAESIRVINRSQKAAVIVSAFVK